MINTKAPDIETLKFTIFCNILAFLFIFSFSCLIPNLKHSFLLKKDFINTASQRYHPLQSLNYYIYIYIYYCICSVIVQISSLTFKFLSEKNFSLLNYSKSIIKQFCITRLLPSCAFSLAIATNGYIPKKAPP